jgi:periplasmic divalent cation tolerance protein
MAEYVQVMTTIDSRDSARELSRRLVEDRAAACVQILGPIESTYRWEGALETGEEWLCLIKTERRLFDRVRAIVGEVHPYEVPELIALSVAAGSAGYLRWISRETSAEPPSH